MSAAAPAGSSSTRISAFNAACPPRSPGRCGTPGRAAAPAGCPLRGSHPRRVRRPGSSTGARGPCVSRRRASSPPGPRSSEIDMPDDVPISTPASPGASWPGSGSSVSVTSWRRAVRVAANGAVAGSRERAGAPTQPRGQPAEEEHPRRAGVRAVANLDRVDRARAHRASVAGRTWRPRARATASSAARRGRPRRRRALSSSARCNALAGSGSFTESIRATWER